MVEVEILNWVVVPCVAVVGMAVLRLIAYRSSVHRTRTWIADTKSAIRLAPFLGEDAERLKDLVGAGRLRRPHSLPYEYIDWQSASIALGVNYYLAVDAARLPNDKRGEEALGLLAMVLLVAAMAYIDGLMTFSSPKTKWYSAICKLLLILVVSWATATYIQDLQPNQ